MSVIKTGKTWTFRTDIGKNPVTGKRKQVYRGGFLTKKEAELAQAEFLTEITANNL
ncbi:MAG: Arm DNA-binding domain-containing protein [Bacillota bacterium]|jgi:predicted small secreted protein|nr:Arm DNA-binding domain-containing protein [Bacillota bacterium]MDP4157880.1 Arm DNA-binding domain-containing protein [Bacillota bacterium]